jgi:hypothetical protein
MWRWWRGLVRRPGEEDEAGVAAANLGSTMPICSAATSLAWAWKTASIDSGEFGTAASYTVFKQLTLAITNWWTFENSGNTGYNEVLEWSASYAFSRVWIFSSSVSALVGRQWVRRAKAASTTPVGMPG